MDRWMQGAALGICVACGGPVAVTPDGGPPPLTTPGLAISGSWVDSEGDQHTISETVYQHAPVGGDALLYHIVSYDNDAGWMAAENDPANGAYGDYSRFDFVLDDPVVFLCHTVPDAPTLPYAESAEPADAADLDGTGCAGDPWRILE